MKEIELKFTDDKIVGSKQVVISELKNFKNSPSAWLNKNSNESNALKEGIFLGIAALRKQPIRPEVQKFIDILFININADNFSKSNALSSTIMCLETVFNSAFILSKNMVAPTFLITTDQKTLDEKAELPHVINDIANHEALRAEEREKGPSNASSFARIMETIQGCRTIVKDYKTAKRSFIFPVLKIGIIFPLLLLLLLMNVQVTAAVSTDFPLVSSNSNGDFVNEHGVFINTNEVSSICECAAEKRMCLDAIEVNDESIKEKDELIKEKDELIIKKDDSLQTKDEVISSLLKEKMDLEAAVQSLLLEKDKDRKTIDYMLSWNSKQFDNEEALVEEVLKGMMIHTMKEKEDMNIASILDFNDMKEKGEEGGEQLLQVKGKEDSLSLLFSAAVDQRNVNSSHHQEKEEEEEEEIVDNVSKINDGNPVNKRKLAATAWTEVTSAASSGVRRGLSSVVIGSTIFIMGGFGRNGGLVE